MRQQKYNTVFERWLYCSEPFWKYNLDKVNRKLFDEIKMSKEQLEELLWVLDEYGVLEVDN